ncbi:toxin-antitoxin system, toxin component, HicA family [Campylobacter lari]|uniref:type II toxin-antitoxin system HicA family toxin n=1 Tax=Campylobacter lari TaxID=201 RepID=UPI001279CDEB|nr:type II toxin-antitoxin system HicA family toxin [Campylobacter lari]EAK0446445.1 type II toxin-antitoxin system HicA family toxin [Campylobacter lari]MCR6517553.1 type II toxin-antitoxin system HicA family toxin [Campylobacter lari]MCV3346531.1 type II toxin-antitoxin system HicA family toxin [Campylobacter lari]MCV3431470.1 type II toxin-antitoxin system HicA family toxin [Campylobacter lari]
MSNKEKLIKELENNPKNASFANIEKLLSWYGYKLEFKKNGKSIIVPLHKPIKEIYVKQILKHLKGENEKRYKLLFELTL